MTTSHENETESTSSQDGSASDEKPTVDELQANIEQTRADLGETVDALTAKMDVKARAKNRVAEVKANASAQLDTAKTKTTDLAKRTQNAATDDQGKPTPAVLSGAGVAAALVVAGVVLLVWRRRK